MRRTIFITIVHSLFDERPTVPKLLHIAVQLASGDGQSDKDRKDGKDQKEKAKRNQPVENAILFDECHQMR